MRTPRGNGPRSNPVVSYITFFDTYFNMVKVKTTFTLGFSLEFQRVKETVKLLSKVLRVAKETIRTRCREIT